MLAGGISALATSLRKIGDVELSKEMKAVSKEAAEQVVPYAKRRVPVQTGRLRDSIKAGTAARGPYARSVHTGRYFKSTGRRTEGNPYLKKAIPEAWPEINEAFLKGMNRIAAAFEKKHGVSRVVGRYGGTEKRRIKRR